MEHEALYWLLEERRKELGLSQAEIGRLVSGKESTAPLQNVKRSSPSVERAKALCDALGIEFYIGPPRDDLSEPALKVADDEFASIPIRDIEISAGSGALNYVDDPDGVPTAFRREWLSRLGINPARAVILRVRGDSMEPTIRAGSIALIDQQRTDPAKNRIYAFVDDGELRMKRLALLPRDALAMTSDNHAYPTEIRVASDLANFKILGEVVWSAYTWHDDPRNTHP